MPSNGRCDQPTRKIMDSWIFQPGHPLITVSLAEGGRSARLSQSRFRYADDRADGSPAGDDGQSTARWVVPVVLRIGRNGGTEVRKVLLDVDTMDVDLGGPADWVVGNDHGTGFYRVAYDDTLLDRLTSRAQLDLTPLERYSLVEDTWGAVLAGRTGVDRLLGVLRSFADETDLSVWQRIVGILGALERMVDDTNRPQFSGFVRSLVAPVAKRLGDRPDRDEPDRVTSLRALLFDVLGNQGDDADVRARAVELYERSVSDPTSVDPELANAAIRVVARAADARRFEDLQSHSTAATTPQDRLRYLGALADVADRDLFERFLGLILTDAVRTQDVALLLRRALVNRVNGAMAWSFISTNWDTLNDRLPSPSMPRLLDGIRVFNTPELADGIEAFLDSHPVVQGLRQVAQHRERMRVNVALRAREADRLAATLS